jgi:hypothetical protein
MGARSAARVARGRPRHGIASLLGLGLLAAALAPAAGAVVIAPVPVLDPATARAVVAGGGAVELAVYAPVGAAEFGRALALRQARGVPLEGAPDLPRARQEAFCPLALEALGEQGPWLRVRIERSDALERVLGAGLLLVPLGPPEVMVGEAIGIVAPPHGVWRPPTLDCAFAPGQREARWLYGDWNGDGVRAVGKYVPSLDAFLLDANGTGLWDGVAGGDRQVRVAVAAGPGEPLVGDWNGDGIDDVGKTVGSRAYLDANGSGRWEGRAGGDVNALFAPSLGDAPFAAGDWAGDGRARLARLAPALGRFLLDANGDGAWDGVGGGDDRVDFPPLPVGPPSAVEPFVADFDGLPGDGVGQAFGQDRAMADLDEDRAFRGAAGGDLDYHAPVLLGLPLRPTAAD